MSAVSSKDDSLEALVGQVADEFIERLDRGEEPDVDEYLRRYPQFAAVLRQVLGSLELMRVAPALADEPDAPAETSGVLGDFRILREAGRGGMGIVYEAEQISLGRRVALKVLPFAATMDPRQLQRFHNEARAAAGLHHTNIVPVYGVGCERGVHFFAMQFIEGNSLAAIIAELHHRIGRGGKHRDAAAPRSASAEAVLRGHAGSEPASATPGLARPDVIETLAQANLSTEAAVSHPAYFRSVSRLGIQAAEALEHAHLLGVIHRDIKPANLLLDARGDVWITDFGLAHCQNQAGLTMTGDLVGTLRYMSPEQALAQRDGVDHRADVYSLGATVYELLTLEPVFAGGDREELLRQIALEEPRRPRRIDRTIPLELETIVLKAIAKNPAERYASAQGMADDLRRYLEGRPVAARRPTLVQHVHRWCRRHTALVRSVIACAVFAALIVAASIGWAIGDRAARQAITDEKAGLALQESLALQQQEKWFEARSAIQRAQALLATGGSPEVQKRVRRRQADLELLAAVERLQLDSTAALRDGTFDIAPRDAAYLQAFRDYGIDVTTARPDEAAEVVRASSVPMELAAALDDWAIVCRTTRAKDDTTWRDLLAIARAADPDAQRNQVRDALEKRDPRALQERMASDQAAAFPPSTVLLLVRVLRGIQAAEPGKSRDERTANSLAIRLLRKAQRRHPHDFWLNHELGWHLASARPPQWAEAIRCYSIARALRPHSALVHVSLAAALLYDGRADDAIACCAEAIRLEPELASAHNNLGYAHRIKGELDQAIRCYRAAIHLKPDLASAHNNLGNALKEKGEWSEAIDCLREAVRLKPGDSRAQHNLATLLLDKGRWEDAVVAFAETVRQKPLSAPAHNDLGVALIQAGRLPEAIAALEKAISLAPRDAEVHRNLGAALRRQGRLREAIAAYRAAIDLDPKLGGAYSNLAWILATAPDEKLRDRVQAVAAAQKAVALARAPELPTCWQRLGVSHYRAGDAKAAVSALRKSVKLGGGDGVDLFFLAMAHWKLGDKDEAGQCYRRALRSMTQPAEEQPRRSYQPLEDELRRFHAEAAQLLGVDE